jgi:hypothetical protein
MGVDMFDKEKLQRMQEKEKEIKKQEDTSESSRLPEGFYKPIKVKKYLEFNREEIYSDI